MGKKNTIVPQVQPPVPILRNDSSSNFVMHQSTNNTPGLTSATDPGGSYDEINVHQFLLGSSSSQLNTDAGQATNEPHLRKSQGKHVPRALVKSVAGSLTQQIIQDINGKNRMQPSRIQSANTLFVPIKGTPSGTSSPQAGQLSLFQQAKNESTINAMASVSYTAQIRKSSDNNVQTSLSSNVQNYLRQKMINGKNNDDFGSRVRQYKGSNANADREKYGRYGDAVNILQEENEEDDQFSQTTPQRAGLDRVKSSGLKLVSSSNLNFNQELMQSNIVNQSNIQKHKRKDRLGNVINQGNGKKWQITFRDTVSKGQSIATIHLVENWKLFNVDEKHHKESSSSDFVDSFAERLRLMRELDEQDKPEGICQCLIF